MNAGSGRWSPGRRMRAGLARRGAERHQARRRLRHRRQVRQILQRRRRHGAEQFKKETGIAFAEFEITNETQFEQAHRRFAQRGQDPDHRRRLLPGRRGARRSPRNSPRSQFTIIDGVVDLPNVQSVLFKEQEGSFLVGMLAAMASKTGKVGFVGGMDIPLIRNFECGYEQGAKYANPKAEVIQQHDRHDARRLERPGPRRRARQGPVRPRRRRGLCRRRLDRPRRLQAANDRGKLAIGVDSNQNYLHPGTMLTSMVKRVDLAAYNAFKAAKDGTWKGGLQVLGLKEGGVDWALDQYNEKLVTPEMKAKVDAAKADIDRRQDHRATTT